jgi:hypothetical protein
MQQPSSENSDNVFVTEEVPVEELSQVKYLKSLAPSEFHAVLKFPRDLIFAIPLEKYPLQPWTRAQKLLKTAKSPDQVVLSRNHLNQWFNYDLTPESYEAYAKRQLEIRDHLLKHMK